MKDNYITQAEYEFLTTRLSKLDQDDKVALADLKHALNYGSETWHDNDMYDTAKNKQININLEKKEIQSILKSSKVLSPDRVSNLKVGIGTRVSLENIDNHETLTLSLGGSEATRLGEDWVSLASPLGRALKNQSKDSVVNAMLPVGIVKYKILDIEVI